MDYGRAAALINIEYEKALALKNKLRRLKRIEWMVHQSETDMTVGVRFTERDAAILCLYNTRARGLYAKLTRVLVLRKGT